MKITLLEEFKQFIEIKNNDNYYYLINNIIEDFYKKYSKEVIILRPEDEDKPDISKLRPDTFFNMMNKFKSVRVNSTLKNKDDLGIKLTNRNKSKLLPFTSYDSKKAVSKNISETIDDARMEKLHYLSKIDFTPVFVDEFIKSGSLYAAIDTAYEISQKKIHEIETEDNESQSELLSSEEVTKAVIEHIDNPEGFQERLANWSEKKKIQYFIIWQIICVLWANFCQPYFQDNIGKPVTSYIVSNVKELPEKGAKVICQLKQSIEAIILENSSYYYKVSFIDEDGIKREGYVAKKNLKVLDEEEHITDNTKLQEVQEESTNE